MFFNIFFFLPPFLPPPPPPFLFKNCHITNTPYD